MAKQTFTTGQVLTAAQMTSLQQTAMGGGSTTAKTASYVLVAADAGTVVQMNAAGATTITVNTALFAAGDTVQIQNIGAGVCTVTAGTATVSTAGSLALSQYEGGQLYFNTTSAALFFDIVQTSGMTNPMTTTGDIIYSSSGSTPARLGIGTTGQVLNVASGLPAWATPSASMTSIASGSIPTGTNILTLSSISASYTHLQLVLLAWNGSGNNTLVAKVNNDSTAVYATNVVQIVAGASAAFGDVDYTSIRLTGNGAANAGNNKNITIMNFPFYTNATTGKIILSTTGFQDSGTTRSFVSTNNYYSGTNAAISRIDITYGSNYSGGTYVLYGVN